jgi:large subunit ribosomal protein L15
MAERALSLSNLGPAQKKQDRKRVGRGLGSGKGRYSGRGIKGQKSRAGSNKMRAGFEGGQMPAYMRLPKQKAQSADAMPIGPFRTSTQAVNLRDLEARFDAGADITVDTLKEAGLIRNTRVDVKILGQGELTKKLTVTAHRFSTTAREKIEAAGGTATALRDEQAPTRSRKRRKIAAKKRAAGIATPAAEEPEAEERDEAETGEGAEASEGALGTVPSGDSPPE